MFEVEAKAVVKDLDAVRERLRGVGAVFVKRVEIRDIYFSHPCRDFGESDEALRVRQVDGECELTYKGPRKVSRGVKSREEYTARVVDCSELIKILEALGFRKVIELVKVREVYKFNGVEIVLDDVRGLGTFVEVEVRAESEEEGRVKVREVFRLLGISEKDITPKTYLEIAAEKGMFSGSNCRR